jgi:hypothetical protein
MKPCPYCDGASHDHTSCARDLANLAITARCVASELRVEAQALRAEAAAIRARCRAEVETSRTLIRQLRLMPAWRPGGDAKRRQVLLTASR